MKRPSILAFLKKWGIRNQTGSRGLCCCFCSWQSVTPNVPRAPEILFKPELIGRDHCGIHESLFKSILSSDIDLRCSLLQNIILSGNGSFLCTVVAAAQVYAGPAVMGGRVFTPFFISLLLLHFIWSQFLKGGNTLLSGFPERLQAEIQGLLPPDMRECVHVISPVDRDFSVWSGGAMLANLQSFNSAWISLEEYEEHGPHIVHRKCFWSRTFELRGGRKTFQVISVPPPHPAFSHSCHLRVFLFCQNWEHCTVNSPWRENLSLPSCHINVCG